MATVEHGFLHAQLEERRQRLHSAATAAPQDAQLARLLTEVDAALERMAKGAYGLCETCHESIEPHRLLADPLVRYCLDHLTPTDRRALEQDLELAAQIQQGLLPPQGLRWGGWEMHYHYEPAGLVSGDYCDVIPPTDGGHLLFVLGDVSGKGVAASLLMSQLHAMFRTLVGVGLPLGQVVERANRAFCESALAGQYATLVCGHADREGHVEIFNAGHCPVLRLGPKGVERLDSSGVPLGMFCTLECKCRTIRLAPGESLFLFTDGASEARDAADAEYGVERLARLVTEKRALQPETMLRTCLDDLRAFSQGTRRADDLSLMVIRRTA